MTYGLLPSGFAQKPLDVIKQEIEAHQLANIAPTLDQSPESPFGQANAIVAAKIAELWEVAQAVYASQYPDSAEGVPLDNVAALTGARRLEATKSVVVVTCGGTPGTVLPVGRIVSVDPSGDRFVSLVEATIGGGGTVAVAFEAEAFGPVVANAGTLTEIETPIAGWDSATNANDADRGRATESDEELRQRRILLLEVAGSSTVDAIRAEVLRVPGVVEAHVYENDTEVTNADGMPRKSIEVVFRGGSLFDVAGAIFNSKPAGIRAFGSDNEMIADSEGNEHEIGATEATEKALEINVEVLTDATFPITGEDMIKASLVAFAEERYRIGANVVRNKLFDAVFKQHDQPIVNGDHPPIPGLLDVTTLEIRFSGAFGTANLPVGSREIATLDTSDITVTVTS